MNLIEKPLVQPYLVKRLNELVLTIGTEVYTQAKNFHQNKEPDWSKLENLLRQCQLEIEMTLDNVDSLVKRSSEEVLLSTTTFFSLLYLILESIKSDLSDLEEISYALNENQFDGQFLPKMYLLIMLLSANNNLAEVIKNRKLLKQMRSILGIKFDALIAFFKNAEYFSSKFYKEGDEFLNTAQKIAAVSVIVELARYYNTASPDEVTHDNRFTSFNRDLILPSSEYYSSEEIKILYQLLFEEDLTDEVVKDMLSLSGYEEVDYISRQPQLIAEA
jgi:hypothetical protein